MVRYDYATASCQAAAVVDLISGDILTYLYISDYERCLAHGLKTDVLAPYAADSSGENSPPRYSCVTTCSATEEGFMFRMTLSSDDGKLLLAGDMLYSFTDGSLSAYTPVETILP